MRRTDIAGRAVSNENGAGKASGIALSANTVDCSHVRWARTHAAAIVQGSEVAAHRAVSRSPRTLGTGQAAIDARAADCDCDFRWAKGKTCVVVVEKGGGAGGTVGEGRAMGAGQNAQGAHVRNLGVIGEHVGWAIRNACVAPAAFIQVFVGAINAASCAVVSRVATA